MKTLYSIFASKKTFLIALLLSSFSTFSQVNLDSGLVGHFAFDNNPSDSSIIGIHGTPYNVTATTGRDNQPNSAYNFNGLTSYVEASTSDRGIIDVVTISLWIKTTRPADDHDFFIEKYTWQTDNGYYIAMRDGYPYLAVRNTSGFGVHTYDANDSSLVNDGNWHHLLAEISENEVSFYIDGQLESSETLAASNPDLRTLSPLSIGYYYTGSPQGDHNYYQGDLDEIRIYNRVLTNDEIQTISTINVINDVPLFASRSTTVKIYPNPASDFISIESLGVNVVRVEMYNSLGKKCFYSENVNGQIDISQLPAGIYFVQLFAEREELVSFEKILIK